MGKYMATINMGGVKRYSTDEFDDSSLETQRLVAKGFLIPQDDVAKAAQTRIDIVEVSKPSAGPEAIKAALAAARERASSNQAESPAESSVSTATSVEGEGTDTEVAPVEEEPQASRGKGRSPKGD